jgi:hypothetical protein
MLLWLCVSWYFTGSQNMESNSYVIGQVTGVSGLEYM